MCIVKIQLVVSDDAFACSCLQMLAFSEKFIVTFLFGIFLHLYPASGIRFVIDREECFSHSVPYEGDTMHVSFVVIKADTPWHYSDDGVDLVVKDPSGAQIHDYRDKTSEKFEFMAQKRGLYRFCFTNKSPYHETIDFDVYIGHFSYFEQHAKDEHFGPLLEQIGKLEEALYNIQFEQHWLEAQTDRQAIGILHERKHEPAGNSQGTYRVSGPNRRQCSTSLSSASTLREEARHFQGLT
ncbi:hypothetical protein ZIOFF_012366 [Zingiber officinale]|uniref:GOLD domain-containing protein n=1 Tax=Zingiber officinale TaxID=94328 RepID=A0A8J5HP94_ZINOF|nr:hypothetical protein ZIOFF_012366 [Zingiber officinale]